MADICWYRAAHHNTIQCIAWVWQILVVKVQFCTVQSVYFEDMGRYSAAQCVSVAYMGRFSAAQYHTVQSVSVADMGRYSAVQKLRQFTALGLAGGTVCGGILLFKVAGVLG